MSVSWLTLWQNFSRSRRMGAATNPRDTALSSMTARTSAARRTELCFAAVPQCFASGSDHWSVMLARA
eukprot:3384454-Pyramimonas_sp.AAC.1